MACWHGWRRPAPPAERDRKSTRLNSSHGYISYAVSLFRKSTRLNSSHGYISYAVFCLKKKKMLDARSCSIGSHYMTTYDLPVLATVTRLLHRWSSRVH